MGITVSGDIEIEKRLKALGEKAHEACKRAATAGADIIRDDAAKRAPRSTINKLHLQDNIVTKKATVKKSGLISAKAGLRNKKFNYGTPVEYGHIVRTKKGYKMVAAQPFIGPARESNMDAVKAKIADVLRKELF